MLGKSGNSRAHRDGTKQAEETKKERRVKRGIEIAAPIEDWKALTGAKELARWFPLEARVTPGELFTGRVEFVREPRDFCLTICELRDDLLWLPIEGPPDRIEVQAWLSALALDPS
jgi:hypothetical protein